MCLMRAILTKRTNMGRVQYWQCPFARNRATTLIDIRYQDTKRALPQPWPDQDVARHSVPVRRPQRHFRPTVALAHR